MASSQPILLQKTLVWINGQKTKQKDTKGERVDRGVKEIRESTEGESTQNVLGTCMKLLTSKFNKHYTKCKQQSNAL